jgi:hypothetical protein
VCTRQPSSIRHSHPSPPLSTAGPFTALPHHAPRPARRDGTTAAPRAGSDAAAQREPSRLSAAGVPERWRLQQPCRRSPWQCALETQLTFGPAATQSKVRRPQQRRPARRRHADRRTLQSWRGSARRTRSRLPVAASPSSSSTRRTHVRSRYARRRPWATVPLLTAMDTVARGLGGLHLRPRFRHGLAPGRRLRLLHPPDR